MQIYEWEFLAICHDLDRSCDHKCCDSGDMFLICHMTSREQMFKGLYEFIDGSLSR